jgi:hypothetical protein
VDKKAAGTSAPAAEGLYLNYKSILLGGTQNNDLGSINIFIAGCLLSKWV